MAGHQNFFHINPLNIYSTLGCYQVLVVVPKNTPADINPSRRWR
jgi:hypothetical protein